MATHKIFDQTIRLTISILFRVVLVLYALSILLKGQNYFQWYIYLGITILYITFYTLLFNRDRVWSYLRLLNDYIFFIVILYKKDLNDFHSMTLLILPILNTLNHSSKTKNTGFSPLLYLFAILSIYFLRGFHIRVGDFIALLAFSTINLFIYLRTEFIDFNTDLYGIVDSFYLEKFQIGRIYEILKKIRDKLYNDSKIIKPKQIVCFRVQNSTLRLLNGSEFVYSFTIDNEKDLLQKLNSPIHNGVQDYPIEVNGIKSTKNMFICNEFSAGVKYVYFIDLEKPISRFFWLFGVQKTLETLFARITRVFEIERELNNKSKNNLEKIKSKIQFVESTIKAVHFLNNKLTPFTSYFGMVQVYDGLKDDDPRKVPLAKLIQEEKKNAISTIHPIIQRTKEILKKSSNPYIVSESEKISLRKLFSIVRKIWDDHNMKKDCLKVNWELSVYDRVVLVNTEAFEFLIDEIIDNIQKHSKTFYEANFYFENDEPVLTFKDDIKPVSLGHINYQILADDFNSPIMSEKMKRKSYGLTFVKQHLQQLKLNYNLSIHNDVYELKLFLKSIEI